MKKLFCLLISLSLISSVSNNIYAADRVFYINTIKIKKVILPLRNQKDAINFALNTEAIAKEISETGKWWISAERFDPVNFENEWVIVIGNGNGECNSPYQCFMRFKSDGTITSHLKCSSGWNCQ